MVTETASIVHDSGVGGAGYAAIRRGETSPKPAQKTSSVSPAWAELPLPATAQVPSGWTIRIEPVPWPVCASVNTPGSEDTRLTGCGAETAPLRVTTTSRLVDTGRSYGSMALIWPAVTT